MWIDMAQFRENSPQIILQEKKNILCVGALIELSAIN